MYLVLATAAVELDALCVFVRMFTVCVSVCLCECACVRERAIYEHGFHSVECACMVVLFYGRKRTGTRYAIRYERD